MAVGQDVRRFQQLVVAQPADGAAPPVPVKAIHHLGDEVMKVFRVT